MRRSYSSLGATLVALLALMLSASGARSTVIADLNLHDLALSSDVVVIGTVSDLRVVESPSERLFTRVTLEDLEVLAGNHVGSTLTFEMAGAYPGGGRYEVAGMPFFRLNQRNLLFLRTPLAGQYMCPVVGWSQGRLILAQRGSMGDEVWIDSNGQVVAGISDRSDWQPSEERLEIPGELPIDAIVRASQEPAMILPVDAAARQSFEASQALQAERGNQPALDADGLLAEIQRYLAFPDPNQRLFRPEEMSGERLRQATTFAGPSNERRAIPSRTEQ